MSAAVCVCTRAPSREPKWVDLKTCASGRSRYRNQQACSFTVVSVNLHLLTGNAESWLFFVHLRNTIRAHQSIRRAHQPALIARLHMIPQIRLLWLMYSRFIWRVANIAFITVSTQNLHWTGSTAQISPQGNTGKVSLSFPCFTTPLYLIMPP